MSDVGAELSTAASGRRFRRTHDRRGGETRVGMRRRRDVVDAHREARVHARRDRHAEDAGDRRQVAEGVGRGPHWTIAEDGAPTALAVSLAADTGITVPLSPGVWALHTANDPLYAFGQIDAGPSRIFL